MKKTLVIIMTLFLSSGANATLTKRKRAFLPKSFSSDFEEIHLSERKRKPKKSFGKIEYMFKGHVRYEVIKPNPVLLVSNPKTTWYYVPPFIKCEEPEIKINPTKDMALFRFLDYLGHGLTTNKYYKVVLKRDESKLFFLDGPTKKTGVKVATLIFNGGKRKFDNLKSIRLLKSDNKIVTINLSNTVKNIKFKVNHFVFTAPAKDPSCTKLNASK